MKKILSILICLVLGISSAWAASGTSTITAYAIYNSNGNYIPGGGSVVASASTADRFTTGEITAGTTSPDGTTSTAKGTGYDGTIFKQDYWIQADAKESVNGFYFTGWFTKSGDTYTEVTNNVTGMQYKEKVRRNISKTVDLYAIFKPVSVEGINFINHITITGLFKIGSGSVVFNVANADDVDDFLVSSSSNEFSAEITSISGNVVTVSVQYTDKNHHGNNVASADITLTSRGDANSKVTAMINVSTNLTPTYTKPADFDFRTIYAGDARGSQTALYATGCNESANQASPASLGATGAKWTATITGDGASAYVLSSPNPEKGQAVVTFRPQTAGTYNAILTLKVDYTDAHGNTISSGTPTETALIGVAETPISSAIVFNPTSWDFGNQVTGYEGSKEIAVSQQNVSNVTYIFGDTNAEGIFSFTEEVGSIVVSAHPVVLGTYSATITAKGNDTRDGHAGETTIGTLPLSITVDLQSPVLTGGSNLKDTYYLKWTKVPHASNYEIYEVIGAEQVLVENALDVVSDETTITKSISSTDAQKTYMVKAISNYNGGTYESWSNQQIIKLNELTSLGTSYLDIYTGTLLTGLSGFAGTKVAKKKVDLINTFDSNGKALFDELYVFGETISSNGESSITAATTTSVNTAVTPCYVFTKSGDGYVLSNTIDNVNQAVKQIPNATSRCWTVNTSQNKKLYFTGFCPFGSNGSTKDDEGVIYIKGAAGASVDVYLEDCQLYARCHTPFGDAKNKDDAAMPSFTIDTDYGGALGGLLGGGSAATKAEAGGSASAIVFECTSSNNSVQPFSPTIHTRGDNVLYSNLGCTGYFNALGKEARIGQYSATVQVRVTNLNSYTTLSFDDKWPTDATDFELHKRTNGSLKFKKLSVNGSSIEIGNENTVVNFNGGRVELQNTLPGPVYYLNTLAISARLGYALYSGLELFVGYGLGQDVVGGEVNFNDGTVYAESVQLKDNNEFKDYLELDENGYTTALRCPHRTYITGGSHNSEIRACSAVDKIGGSPRDKKGNALVKLDYQLPGDANILTNSETGLVKPETMPNQLVCVGCGDGGINTVLDLTNYGKQSLSPDKNNYIHLWAPGAERIEYSITSWVISMTEVTASLSGNSRTIGGDISVPSSNTDKVNRLLYAHIDKNLHDWLNEGDAKIPFRLADKYESVEVSNVSNKQYANIENNENYDIHEEMYYMRVVTADEWIMFAPPFDISNIYVVETSSETKLEEKCKNENRDAALKLQAERNMDFASILVAYLEQDAVSTTNRTFWSHYDAVLSEYAADPTNKTGEQYLNDIVKTQLVPYTSGNYNAHFFLYESENNEWNYLSESEDGKNEQFQPDWKIAQPITKMIGERERTVLMEQGKIYAMQFPFCPNCDDLDTRQFWDYWTGKVVIFEGYGPQTIAGRNVAKMIASEEYSTPNYGQLRPNPILAEYQVNWLDADAEGYLSNALFIDSYDNLFYSGDNSASDSPGLLKAGDVYMVANITSPSGMPRRIASINPVSGEITYRDETTTSTPTIGGNKHMLVYNINGGVGIVPVVEQQVSVYNAAGQLVTSQYLTDEVHIPLPSGIYLIAGAKEQFKVVVK